MKIKEKRLEEFKAIWIDELNGSKHILSVNEFQDGYHIKTKQFGLVAFYPKGDKLHLCSENKWLSNGLEFLVKNILGYAFLKRVHV